MSAPADLFDFDFQSGGPFPPARTAITLVSNGGEVNGIAQWIALKLDEEGWYENDPGRGVLSSWPVMLWPLVAARNCPEGTAVTVRGNHDRLALRIWAEA
jgi:hypothetical protein